MSPQARLVLNPRLCDRCGRCLSVCPLNALRVGRSYIMVDWVRCDGCNKCVSACKAGAIKAVGGASQTPRARSSAAVSAAGKKAAPHRATKPVKRKRPYEGFEWSLLEAAATLSVTFSAFMAKEAFTASKTLLAMPTEVLVPIRIGVLAIYYALQVALLRWLIHRRDGSFAEAFGLGRLGTNVAEKFRSIGLVAAGLLGTRVIATVYGLVTRELGLTPQAGADTVTRVFGTAPGGLLLAVIMLVFIGPFVEELVFRGALLRGLQTKLGVWPAIVIQALLFAAFHRSWWLLLPMTVLGIALGWLAHERRSLWPAIALHALYNALSVAAVVWVVVAGGVGRS
ncbi:MAG: CPBP family glutamic-type intramembrane protease [Coriobacteriia bacterium]|nr:CPBP family glutamic-type intramembrane protease [Coriobacteriia bacterium]